MPPTTASAFSRRVELYELYGYALDRLATRDSAEALRVEAVLRAAEVAS